MRNILKHYIDDFLSIFKFRILIDPNTEEKLIPLYKTDGASGCDFCAAESGIIYPGESKLIPTGVRMVIPKGYELQLRPRSGLALNSGITMLDTPATIDSDYRGEIGIVLINHSNTPFKWDKHDRIGQGVFTKVRRATFIRSRYKLSSTLRGTSGFGHTGIN